MICVSLSARTASEALAGMEEARSARADLVEIRGDHLEDPAALSEIVRRKTLPVLATVRPEREGGRWSSSEEERFRLLEAACAAGADYVDVEFRGFREFPRGSAKLVLSCHDFDRVPADLEATAAAMEARKPHLVKIAVAASGAADLIRCVRLQKSMAATAAVIPMGPAGEAARILYRRCGAAWTYAALRAGAETAPGQVAASEIAGDVAKAYAVVGNPVAHSKSPALFNAAFRALGMDARYVKIPLEDAALLPDLVSALGLSGVSVTIPHKEAVARMLGIEQPVNTVVVREGRLEGHNTDAPAAVEAIGDVAGRRVLILGAGGAARAIAGGLARAGAKVAVSSRKGDSMGYEPVPWGEAGGAEIVVNATSVGMARPGSPQVGTDESPFPARHWRAGMRAFDVVYTPRETRFLREAKAAGAVAIPGIEMFVGQARRQFRLFTGREMPEEAIRTLEA